IHKMLLWAQPAQILDAYVDGNRMVILDAASVTTLAQHNGNWQRDQSIGITTSHNFPRDLRGLVVPAKDHLADAYLPGTICSVAGGGGIAISCRDSDDPWPLGAKSALFNSGRNYFTETLSIYKPGGPFYSLVSIPHPGYDLLIATGIDGQVRTNDGTNTRVLSASTTADWGSDIAAVKSGCGGGTQLLVTSAVDDTSTDSLRAFEIPDRNPVQVSAGTDFSGPITALWTHGESVTAVSHNLRTGSYEAYSVSVTCNQ
ncbi:MAG TPA: hypothetical protein VG897_17900, partial [Terriglobales bacterium]|nr:hypothetical protein [Terriglobales bacterium]